MEFHKADNPMELHKGCPRVSDASCPPGAPGTLPTHGVSDARSDRSSRSPSRGPRLDAAVLRRPDSFIPLAGIPFAHFFRSERLQVLLQICMWFGGLCTSPPPEGGEARTRHLHPKEGTCVHIISAERRCDARTSSPSQGGDVPGVSAPRLVCDPFSEPVFALQRKTNNSKPRTTNFPRSLALTPPPSRHLVVKEVTYAHRTSLSRR